MLKNISERIEKFQAKSGFVERELRSKLIPSLHPFLTLVAKT